MQSKDMKAFNISYSSILSGFVWKQVTRKMSRIRIVVYNDMKYENIECNIQDIMFIQLDLQFSFIFSNTLLNAEKQSQRIQKDFVSYVYVSSIYFTHQYNSDRGLLNKVLKIWLKNGLFNKKN